jgi:hypothetical protein
MIRHVIMVQFRPGATEEQIGILTTAWDDFRSRYKGLLGLTFGRDLGLREGNMPLVAVFDFVDEDAFRVFDTDDHHNRVRQEIAPFVERAERCQFRL